MPDTPTPARPRHRVRRIRRLGHRAVDQPAPPDVAPGAREPGAVRRVARPAPAAARRARPGAHRPAAAARPRAAARGRTGCTCSRRWSCRCTAAGWCGRSTPACCPRSCAAPSAGWACDAPILWAYVPQAEVLIDALEPSLVVYHCVDDIAAHERIDTASFRAAEERFAAPRRPRAGERAGAGRAAAEHLAQRAGRAQRRRHRAVRAARSSPGPLDPQMAALPAPRIVFTGAIVADQARPAAARRAGAPAPASGRSRSSGPVGPGDPHTDVSALAAEPNVHLLGPRAYAQLPDVLRGADAGLIPYARNAAHRRASSR